MSEYSELKRLARNCLPENCADEDEQDRNETEFLREVHPAEVLGLLTEVEQLRMQLAACGVVAMSNTQDSAALNRKIHPDYVSASCQDVMRAVDSEMALRAEVERLTLATTEQRQIIEGLTGGMDSTTALLRIGRLETEVEGLRKAINARAPGPRSLQQVGTGALYGEQDYCFRKGWKEGVASFRKQLRAAMAAKEGS